MIRWLLWAMGISGLFVSCQKRILPHSYLYIYNSENQISDSIPSIDGTLDGTLPFYQEQDSISRMIDNVGYFSVFTRNDEKFAVTIDSVTKVYKQTPDGFKIALRLPIAIGTSKPNLREVDMNRDRFKDALLKIPTGGTAGDIHVYLFYNPDQQQLVYDSKTELWNAQWDPNHQMVHTHNKWSSADFRIDRYGFTKLHQMNLLKYTSDEASLANLMEIITYDPKDGSIANTDTLPLQNCTPEVDLSAIRKK